MCVRVSRVVVLAVLVVLALVPGVPDAGAATSLTVTTTVDGVDAVPGDGTCDNGSGACTLRAAVQEANASPSIDTIVLPAGTFALTLGGAGEDDAATGDLDVTASLTVQGAGAATVINAQSLGDRVWHVPASGGPSLVLRDLTVRNGSVSGHGAEGSGGGVRFDSTGTLTLDGVVIRNNKATTTLGDFGGGGFFAGAGSVQVTSSTVRDNLVVGENGDGGGGLVRPGAALSVVDSSFMQNETLDGSGGALRVWDGADAEVSNSTFTGNDTGRNGGALRLGAGSHRITGTTLTGNEAGSRGGAIRINDGTLELLDSTLAGNSSVGNGGGLRMDGSATVTVLRTTIRDNGSGDDGGGVSSTGTAGLTVADTTISGNTAAGDGGGLALGNGTTAGLTNVTVSGNTAGDDGGGMRANAGPSMTLRHVTVAGNRGASADGVFVSGSRTVTLRGSIVANGGPRPDCATVSGASVTSGGGNVAGDASCALVQATDQASTDPLLGPLAANGGPTSTRALQANSPAVDAAGACGLATDQRGVDRPQGAGCDAGAFERGSSADLRLTDTVTPSAATVGQLVRFTSVVRNDGPDIATDVTLVRDVPARLAFSDASPGCVHSAGEVTCSLGSLANGESRSVNVVMTATGIGDAVSAAVVASPVTDPNPADNTASTGVTIAAADESIERISGVTRIETAVRSSETTFDDGEAGAVVLARADAFPDALSGTPLAVANTAPLLLSFPSELHPDTEAELLRVLPAGGPVYVLGGTSALSAAVEERITELGYEAIRLGGPDRFHTAVLISEALPETEAILIATGLNFADALAAGAAAAHVDGAVILTADDVMPGPSAAFLAGRPEVPRYAVGGPAAQAAPEVSAIVGRDRFATAIGVASEFFSSPTAVGLATGEDFADALSGAAHIGRRGGPMLLSARAGLPTPVGDYLHAETGGDAVVFLYGGTSALSDAVAEAVAEALAR